VNRGVHLTVGSSPVQIPKMSYCVHNILMIGPPEIRLAMRQPVRGQVDMTDGVGYTASGYLCLRSQVFASCVFAKV
jgi:hypothetical protein